MAWTSWGFDGTINEAQWSQMAGLLGNDYVAAGNGDCLVTAVPGARSVSVAAGTLYGDGVVSVNSGAVTVAMTTPVNGQWYVIALRRTWATNTAALVAIAGATTTTTTPTAPPSSFPSLNTQPGVLTDQPIAWAWCNSANTTVVVYDIRKRAVKSMPAVVANANERDAKYMTPTQGLQVWRDDLGAVETYYGLFNSSTNPGGRDTAGWYTSDRSGGLIPIKPTAATIVTGTGSANALGVISFNGATVVSLDGVFSSKYKNYKILLKCIPSPGSYGASFYLRFRAAGTDATTNYYYGGSYFQASTHNVYNSTGTSTQIGVLPDDGTLERFFLNLEVFAPNEAVATKYDIKSGTIFGGNNYSMNFSGMLSNSNVYDGLTIYPGGSGNVTGTIQVFGYNDK